MLLLAVQVVRGEQCEQGASKPVVHRLDARCRVRPDAAGDCNRSWRDVYLRGIVLPFSMRPRDEEKLLGVRAGSLSELARQTRQATLVLHVMQQLRRAIGVRSNDDLLRGVRVTMEMRRALGPTRVSCMDLESAAIERDEVVHLMQLVDLDSEPLCKVEIVRRHLVLGVVAAADLAVAACDASRA